MAENSLSDEIVDWPRFNEIRGMVDADSFSEILDSFKVGTTQHLQTMRDAFNAENFDQIRKSGHAMRGGASNLGAPQVSAMCTLIEDAALAGDAARLAELIPQAESAAAAFSEAAVL